ncbi:oxygen-independent coproporphyrinogen III oxidase [Algoriphagus sp. AGSA1]|uniref:oxygen-independent coproporphyrinogen III oxidase n=1 Tax=Algoriphagus sp. AGSA1 TaxID=2907213 RepID=UPI001F3B4DF5|nr:oxygen-independent coproporphyrinogen III oxidase [Algoriphagus sp. AGSA1]MCE7054842.1 oxygen-independent coproporphyrinogen III oxidase [Algoriphagus sp. AGSA1]
MTPSSELVKKYNQPSPRYTSYPTLPLWENSLKSEVWEELVKKAFLQFGKKEGISLYIHLPFCESLCTYCGCNKRITKNKAVKAPYIQALLAEWRKYTDLFNEKPKIAGIHLGGGTPTFFDPECLHELISQILGSSERMSNAEFSFEGHPNNTSFAHLMTLKELGFDRVSFGIQDFDEQVQTAIHRIQPFEKVKNVTDSAKILGYTSINFDLIYGLPHQTLESMTDTIAKVQSLKPDRIAFYSYAHLPSAFPAQKSFEQFLPSETQKKELYETGRALLKNTGYEEIGMDHFALPGDPLVSAKSTGQLHRNFMGYTTLPSKVLIGLGSSSISDVYFAYAQNTKGIESYQSEAISGSWALQKGHILTDKDIQVRNIILDLICKNQAEIPQEIWNSLTERQFNSLREMECDQLISIASTLLTVREEGMHFVRNICTQIDLRLAADRSKKELFSKVV